jgi:hypothetical protein
MAAVKNKYGAILARSLVLHPVRRAHGPYVHGSRAEVLPVLRLLQRPAKRMEVVQDEVGVSTGD